MQKEKQNVLLVSEPGVGRKSAVRSLAARLASKTVPDALREARLYELKPARRGH